MLVSVVENGRAHLYDVDKYKYKTYIKKSIEIKFDQKKDDKLTKYELN